MSDHSSDEAEGRIKEAGRDGDAHRSQRFGDALRTIKDAADKLSDRIRLPNPGLRHGGEQRLR